MNRNSSWVEKYRPRKLSEVTSQDDTIHSLRNAIKTKNIPHLIFFGPSGCGKTSTILALARELYGPEYFFDRIIELNASDERGINVIREKVKTYAKHAVRLNDNIPKFKIIILDEADSMTSDSQFALRRIMEEYSKVTRFCIICNYHNKIIDPIVSRCSLFRFKPISEDRITTKLNHICKMENMICSDNNLKKIVKLCRGDLRKAVNFLQRCQNSFGDKINDVLLDEISGVIKSDDLDKLIQLCKNKDCKNLDKFIKNLHNNGYSLVNQILAIHDKILKDNTISSKKKSIILKKVAEVDQSLLKGSDEFIQFMRLSYNIMTSL
jgi:replication factor C subunit 2/4